MYRRHLKDPSTFKTNIHRTNNTKEDIHETEQCIAKESHNSAVTKWCNDQCPIPPCHADNYEVLMMSDPSPDRVNMLELAFTFPQLVEETIEDIPAYNWQDLFANFGGCVGLMTGASVLSLFEILIYAGMTFYEFAAFKMMRESEG